MSDDMSTRVVSHRQQFVSSSDDHFVPINRNKNPIHWSREIRSIVGKWPLSIQNELRLAIGRESGQARRSLESLSFLRGLNLLRTPEGSVP
jgi:hypothetical protein